jgi:DNA-binding transcriptional LysR family regulator
MFELYQLKYFLAVVETGNFTKAAERACVTQPTLSVGIKKLETILGTSLFQRTSRRVFLTEAGTRFVERAKSIMFECNQATLEVAEVDAPRVLRLGVLRTLPAKLVSRLLGDFHREDAGAVIELFEGTEQEIQNRLDEGSIDLAITIIKAGEKTNALPLFEEGYVLILSQDHPLANKDKIHGSELANDSMLVRTRCEVLSETSRYFTDLNIRPRLVYRTEQDERALQMVAAGLGVTVVPESYQAEGIKKVPLVGFNFRREIGIKTNPHGVADGSAELLTRFVQFTSSGRWS